MGATHLTAFFLGGRQVSTFTWCPLSVVALVYLQRHAKEFEAKRDFHFTLFIDLETDFESWVGVVSMNELVSYVRVRIFRKPGWTQRKRN